MKYIEDVLKPFDNAIVAETKRLKEIYGKLLKESCVDEETEQETCPECGKDPCICKEDKPEDKLMSVEDFFAEDANEETEPAEDKPVEDQVDESDEDIKWVPASSVFEDSKDETKTTMEDFFAEEKCDEHKTPGHHFPHNLGEADETEDDYFEKHHIAYAAAEQTVMSGRQIKKMNNGFYYPCNPEGMSEYSEAEGVSDCSEEEIKAIFDKLESDKILEKSKDNGEVVYKFAKTTEAKQYLEKIKPIFYGLDGQDVYADVLEYVSGDKVNEADETEDEGPKVVSAKELCGEELLDKEDVDSDALDEAADEAAEEVYDAKEFFDRVSKAEEPADEPSEEPAAEEPAKDEPAEEPSEEKSAEDSEEEKQAEDKSAEEKPEAEQADEPAEEKSEEDSEDEDEDKEQDKKIEESIKNFVKQNKHLFG